MQQREALINTIGDTATTLLLAAGAGVYSAFSSPSVNQTTLTAVAAFVTSGLPFLLLLDRSLTLLLILSQLGTIVINLLAAWFSLGGGKHAYSPFLILVNVSLAGIGVIHLNVFRALYRTEKGEAREARTRERRAVDEAARSGEAQQCRLSALGSAQSLLFPLATALGLRALVFSSGSWIFVCLYAPVLLVATTFLWVLGAIQNRMLLRLISIACFATTLFLSVLLTIELNHCARHTYTACLISLFEPWLFGVWVGVIWLCTLFCWFICKSILHYSNVIADAKRKQE